MTPGSTRRAMAIAAAVLAVVIAASAGLLVGDRMASSTPGVDSVDAGFARDMQIHHAQAVEMSLIVRDRTLDPAVRTLAYDILASQQHQRGQMAAWLTEWSLPQTSTDPVMQWMRGDMGDMAMGDTSPGGAVMPGMATAADVDGLRELSGVEAEIRYLELMTVRHRAGVEMAQYAADHAAEQQVVDLAQAMVSAQDSEIALMNDMLAARDSEA
ncbi:DUF305 domain-containing protein [soil metagenome]